MIQKIKDWLFNIIVNNNVPNNVIVLHFGLYETEKGYYVYLVGCDSYDEENDDWASDFCYEPTNEGIEVVLDEECSWQEFQNRTKSTFLEVLNGQISKYFFKNKIVTIGFDDGDIERIM